MKAFVYVFRNSSPIRSRQEYGAQTVGNMLLMPDFVTENREAVARAVELFSRTNADFADCLIAKVVEAYG